MVAGRALGVVGELLACDWDTCRGGCNASRAPRRDERVRGLTPEEIIIGGLADVAWTVAYLLAIRQARKDRRYGFPLVAITTMWSFEFCFAVIWPFPYAAARVIEFVWLALDSVLLFQTFRYSPRSIGTPLLARYAPVLVGVTLAIMFAGMITFTEFYSYENGWMPAIVAMGMIAAPFPILIATRPGALGISWSGLWWRVAADVLTTINILLMPFYRTYGGEPEGVMSTNNPFTQWIAAGTLMCDGLSLWLMWRIRKGARDGPLTGTTATPPDG